MMIDKDEFNSQRIRMSYEDELLAVINFLLEFRHFSVLLEDVVENPKSIVNLLFASHSVDDDLAVRKNQECCLGVCHSEY